MEQIKSTGVCNCFWLFPENCFQNKWKFQRPTWITVILMRLPPVYADGLTKDSWLMAFTFFPPNQYWALRCWKVSGRDLYLIQSQILAISVLFCFLHTQHTYTAKETSQYIFNQIRWLHFFFLDGLQTWAQLFPGHLVCLSEVTEEVNKVFCVGHTI